MGALLDLLDTIVEIRNVHARHGIKGCTLIVLALVAILGTVIAFALWLGGGA
jgi:hypothetical protein